ncbi:hypothetical protein BD408DRAFT_422727 [Parasitella parasitica]|nr:hypothetical protein BD408DRAFT_422727 [Parasitella parasitica]
MSKTTRLPYLPSEIIYKIFEHVQDVSGRKKSTSTFYQCLFVCKNLSALVQGKLLEKVDLTTNQIAGFATMLVSNPQLGFFVKDLRIYSDDEDSEAHSPPFVELHLDIILRCTPNLEIFGSPSVHLETNFCWSSLVAARDNQLKRLKRFDLSEWTPGNQTIYSSLCSKSAGSLTSLRLYFGDASQDTVFSALKSRIREFVSLEQLVLVSTFVDEHPIILELDTHINNCVDKVRSLCLKNCRFSSDHNYTGQFNTNDSIRNLELRNSMLSSAAIQYFATKLTALQTFALTTDLYNTTQSELDEPQWWRLMINLCKRLRYYNINVKSFRAENYLHQIKGGIDLLNATADHSTIDSTEFTMHLGHSDSTPERYIIEMKRNRSTVRLFGSEKHSDFFYGANYSRVLQFMEQFSPGTIRILNVAHSTNFEKLSHNPLWFSPASIESFSIGNWPIFTEVISLIEKKSGSVVHLDKMIFPDSDQVELIEQRVISRDTSISKFKLTNSLFYPDVLSKMLKFPKIDTLVFDSCIFITNYRCYLEISLPETKLGCLELNLNRTFYSNSLEYPAAASFTIVLNIGTAKTAYVYIKDGQQVYQKPLSGPRTADNFVISIKCQELQSLVIADIEFSIVPGSDILELHCVTEKQTI